MKLYIKAAEGLNSKQRAKIAKTTSNPRELTRLAFDNSKVVREQVAKNPNTPLETLAQLVNDENQDVRTGVALNPKTPTELLAQLANDENAYARYVVALNPKTSPEALTRLVEDEDTGVCYTAARNGNMPAEILAQLANSEDETLRQVVAWNPNTSAETLAQLANDENAHARYGVASNLNTSAETLSQLANDEDFRVRFGVAKNPNTPSEVAAQLADSVVQNPKASKQRKSPSNEWSVKLYELDNYSSIAGEIDEVLKTAVDEWVNNYHDHEQIDYTLSTDNYDEPGTITFEGYGEVDLQQFLAALTSSQRKKDCIKKAANYLKAKLG